MCGCMERWMRHVWVDGEVDEMHEWKKWLGVFCLWWSGVWMSDFSMCAIRWVNLLSPHNSLTPRNL